jgi:hypothetical protein
MVQFFNWREDGSHQVGTQHSCKGSVMHRSVCHVSPKSVVSYPARLV